MPSTLDLFTRELKYIGVSSTLWEIYARMCPDDGAHIVTFSERAIIRPTGKSAA